MPEAKQAEDAWEAFEQLGQSLDPGRLPEASVRHDEYLSLRPEEVGGDARRVG